MQRMRTLIKSVKEKYPNDKFFDSVAKSLQILPQARALYRAYDKALACLDVESWEILSDKAVAHFRDHRKGQLKQGFFNQLNEAFAYQFLLRQGYTHVSVLPENGKTTPDLAYRQGASIRYCEVKSIGISDEQVARWGAEMVFDGSVHQELSSGFLQKLDADIQQAYDQIASKGADGIVFIVTNFDDITLEYYKRYKEQIEQYLSQKEKPEVYIKIGLIGGRKIHRSLLNRDLPSALS